MFVGILVVGFRAIENVPLDRIYIKESSKASPMIYLNFDGLILKTHIQYNISTILQNNIISWIVTLGAQTSARFKVGIQIERLK